MPDDGRKAGGLTKNMAAARLLSFVERIERLEEEKKALSQDIGEIKNEAASAGFDKKVLNQMLKERRMQSAERDEFQALCEVYRAALGMLNGTPLGDHARQRLSEMQPRPDGSETEKTPNDPVAKSNDILSEEEADQIDNATAKPAAVDPMAARSEGAAAAMAGRPVLDNPYPAHDACRAAWDEGYCSAAGTDGMDIPAAWRRTSKKSGKGDEA